MGVHDGGKALHHLHNSTFNQLISLVGKEATDHGRQGRPAVACDMNWICYRILPYDSKGSPGQALANTRVLLRLVHDEGIQIYAVFDSLCWRHSKKASMLLVIHCYSSR